MYYLPNYTLVDNQVIYLSKRTFLVLWEYHTPLIYTINLSSQIFVDPTLILVGLTII